MFIDSSYKSYLEELEKSALIESDSTVEIDFEAQNRI